MVFLIFFFLELWKWYWTKRNLKTDIFLLITIRIIWLTSQLLAPDLLNFHVFLAYFLPGEKKYEAKETFKRKPILEHICWTLRVE